MANSVYSNARAKALENYLLGKERLNRMAESENAEDALRILSEVNFGDGITLDNTNDFERLIDVEREKLFDFIREVAPSEDLKKYFLLKNDFHNAEAGIKAKYLKIDETKMTVSNGLIDKDLLKEKILIDEYKDFPEEMANALLKCDEAFVSGKANGAFVGRIFKQAYYSELSKCASKNKALKELFAVKVDCVNIGTAMRSRDFEVTKSSMVFGGSLKEDDLKFLCEESFEVIKERFKFHKLANIIEAAATAASSEKPLSDFETLADGYALSYLKKFKYSSDGVYPFLLYVFYKLAELDNVRIILVGLLSGHSSIEIKGRLRESYEG